MFLLFITFSIILILTSINKADTGKTYLEKSVPFIGADKVHKQGFDGKGIKIGVIDTGIDYTHSDLFGFDPEGKVIGGYDYVDNDNEPLDTNGHGTQVAGIIAADGNLKGVAPKAKLFSYRVSATGESVSSEFIVKAIHQAIEDQVDIINISLGVNKTNSDLDEAVKEAVKKGIVVVAAAGNSGPALYTIGSPAKSIEAITVGASYNNITSSLVSTLVVDEKHYETIPMLGTDSLSSSISARIIFGGYGRISELTNQNTKDSIILVERGSDVEGEKIFFSEKETNAARMGAKAIIVYNNEPGIFFGELRDPNENSNYKPSIPALSLSREDGLELRAKLQNQTIANINVFYHPDFVTPFSSRGPVSAFYIKPDLLAPGVFVNSTTIGNRYNLTSGTSFAAPHVAGAAAILLEKYSNLRPIDVSSLLSTTTEMVFDSYGNVLPVEIAGSGRINVSRAFSSNIIIIPHNLIFNLSLDNPIQTQFLHLKSLEGSMPQIQVKLATKEDSIRIEHVFVNDSLQIEATLKDKKVGVFEKLLTIDDGKTTYHIPILIHVTKGTIKTTEEDGKLNFSLEYPEEWLFAKIIVSNNDTDKVQTTSITPQKKSSIAVYEPSEYLIEAQITTKNGTDYAYSKILAKDASERIGLEFLELIGIPSKSIMIITGIIIATVLLGLKLSKSRKFI